MISQMSKVYIFSSLSNKKNALKDIRDIALVHVEDKAKILSSDRSEIKEKLNIYNSCLSKIDDFLLTQKNDKKKDKKEIAFSKEEREDDFLDMIAEELCDEKKEDEKLLSQIKSSTDLLESLSLWGDVDPNLYAEVNSSLPTEIFFCIVD